MKCPFCNKNMNKYDGHHIYKCKKNDIGDSIKTKFIYISFNYPMISKKNILYDEYVINLKSFPVLRDEYRISYRSIDFLLEYHDIKKRSKSLSSKLISINKYKETCLDKYGVDNVSKLDNIKIMKKRKWKDKKIKKDIENNIKKYEWIKDESQFGNIDNLYKNMDKNIMESEYFKIIRLYHKHWQNLNDEEKNIISNNNIPIESVVSNLLDKLNISYIKNFRIGRKIYDIKIYNTLLIIEVNSDLWHANPLLYNINDTLDFPFKQEKARDVWYKDEMKKTYAKNNGYKILYIWEKDIKEKDNKFIIDEIKKNLA